MKNIIASFLILITSNCFSQVEIGYLSGATKQGVNPKNYQPIYGLTIQRKFNKTIGLESDFVYSQRMNKSKIQADYLQFMLLGKIGFFGKKIGGYGGIGFSLNPTLDHSNPENHTYTSFIPSVGGEWLILPKTTLDMKVIYDKGLTGGFFKDEHWTKYQGFMIMTTIKFKIG